MKKILPLLLAAALSAGSASALEIRRIESPSGKVVFEARFFDVGDGIYWVDDDDGSSQQSAWHWRPELIDQIVQGMEYWAEVIQPVGNAGPAVIHIGTDSVPSNAFGFSPSAPDGGMDKTFLQHLLQGRPADTSGMSLPAHAVFGLGVSDYPAEHRYSQIPLSGKDDLVATAIHELAHGLGLSGSAEDHSGPATPRFGSVLNQWDSLMVDDHGRPASPGQDVICHGCNNPVDASAFDARADKARLVGKNILDALEGGLPGVPISMYAHDELGQFVDDNNMSHIELRNSQMSHQNFRNYTGFMEAELAVLQDLGYSIDRRNFFGRSVYGDGLDIVNDRGYFARSADGTQYLAGQYNRATLGLGLHVYGSNNTIRQTADLLTAGRGGAGIRVDGEGNNTIVIDPGVKVYANGTGGQGVMFTYGRGHALVHRGDVEAAGPYGVALRFDFGANMLGNDTERRGSYIRSNGSGALPLLPELNGSLADQVDITGRLAGSEAAIHIADNAHVGAINVMNGAVIQGDIVSHYAERDGAGQFRLTTLSFGRQADGQGRATGQADSAFRFAYAGNIRGQDNFQLSFDGGLTRLNGQHAVQGATVQAGAALGGSSVFTLAPGGVFANHGTVAPGNSIGRIDIDGDFQQSASGRLEMEFDADGGHDVLAVSGTADLGGTLALAPMADWYRSGWSAQTSDVVTAGAMLNQFDSVVLAQSSPTLDFSVSSLGGQRYQLSASRAPDAYSRHAVGGNERAAGQALLGLASRGPDGVGALFQALDFSAADGSQVGRTLGQISPQGYSASLAASLLRERDVMNTALRGLGDGMRSAGTQWRGFAAGFGGEGRQSARGTVLGYDATTYGLLIGGGRRLASQPDVAVGVHLDVAEQSVAFRPSGRGKGEATSVGVGAQLAYRPETLSGPHAEGGARFGIEQGRMNRRVSVGGYDASHKADWTGHVASVQAGGGYRWKLGDALSAGPFASLNYARVSRPGVRESGPTATRLSLDSQRVDALRSSIGVGVSLPHELRDGSTLNAQLRLSWDREWLDRDVVQSARFSAAPDVSFKAVNAVLPRDSMSLRAGVAWQRGDRFAVGLDLGGRVGGGYRSVDGQMTMRWAF